MRIATSAAKQGRLEGGAGGRGPGRAAGTVIAHLGVSSREDDEIGGNRRYDEGGLRDEGTDVHSSLPKVGPGDPARFRWLGDYWAGAFGDVIGVTISSILPRGPRLC